MSSLGRKKRSLAELPGFFIGGGCIAIDKSAWRIYYLHIWNLDSASFIIFFSLLRVLSIRILTSMLLVRRLDRGLSSSALRSTSFCRPSVSGLSRLGFFAARSLPRHTISTSTSNRRPDSSAMAEYADGVGAWGAWQVEPSKFTQLVVNSMRTLYVILSSCFLLLHMACL